MGTKLGIIGIIVGIAIIALLIPSAHASAPSCPPDIAIKWYALVNYLAYASGQNATQLIAEAQATGNFTVTISGVKLVVPYCSLNATAANGSKLVFAPAVGAGELKKLGLNITQAKAVFQKLKAARDQAMSNLDRYLKPLEELGLGNATKALSQDRGYGEAAEVNLNASASLKMVAEILEKVGANKTMVEQLIAAAQMHEQIAQLLQYLKEAGGLSGLKRGVASNMSAVIINDRGYFNASRAIAEAAARLSILAEDLARVNSTIAERLLRDASVLNNSALALAYMGLAGGIGSMNRNAALDLTSALNGTTGVDMALLNVEKSLMLLNETLKLLQYVNASQTALQKVRDAVMRHEEALEVLKALQGAGGSSAVEQNIYGALEMGQSLNPNVVRLCIDLNLTQILAEYSEEGINTTALQLKYGVLCEITKLLDWGYYVNKTKRGVMVPMSSINNIILALRYYIDKYGGLLIFRNVYSLKMLLRYIISLENNVGIQSTLQIPGVYVGGQVTGQISIGGSGMGGLSGGGNMSGGGRLGSPSGFPSGGNMGNSGGMP